MLLCSMYSYIKWTQDNFKAGGHKADLLPLLERCTRKLQGMDRYKDDVRYLRVWVQYVSLIFFHSIVYAIVKEIMFLIILFPFSLFSHRLIASQIPQTSSNFSRRTKSAKAMLCFILRMPHSWNSVVIMRPLTMCISKG